MSVFAVALLFSAQASVAPQPAAPVLAPAVKPAKEKKICKIDDADSGSHMVKRLCLTAQEWQDRGDGQNMTHSSRSGITGRPTDH